MRLPYSLELIDFFKDDRMDFELGAELKYNNSGYVILGYIIELVPGQSYADFVQEHIFQKLGMNAARNGSHFQVIPNQAYGYHQKDDYVNRNYVSPPRFLRFADVKCQRSLDPERSTEK